jgi:hypothetical protein
MLADVCSQLGSPSRENLWCLGARQPFVDALGDRIGAAHRAASSEVSADRVRISP